MINSLYDDCMYFVCTRMMTVWNELV